MSENNHITNTKTGIKSSFPPVAGKGIKVLILGTLPGDLSLRTGEYFAHPGNRFWKIISAITGEPLPREYPEKLKILHRHSIGVWNVLQQAERKGSLDHAIRNETPNDLSAFISAHKELEVIGFDGLKPAAFYDKYFERRKDLRYLTLPGCSAANARYDLEALCGKWEELLRR